VYCVLPVKIFMNIKWNDMNNIRITWFLLQLFQWSSEEFNKFSCSVQDSVYR